MKIAVACQESRLSSLVAERFARAPFFLVYDTATAAITKLASGYRNPLPNDGGLNVAVTLVNEGIEAVIAGRFGHRVENFFKGANVALSRATHINGSYALDRLLQANASLDE